jgi:hypothetical protein
VRAQVDRDLTTVSCFDRLLGLIKNLERHKDPARPNSADARFTSPSPTQRRRLASSLAEPGVVVGGRRFGARDRR